MPLEKLEQKSKEREALDSVLDVLQKIGSKDEQLRTLMAVAVMLDIQLNEPLVSEHFRLIGRS